MVSCACSQAAGQSGSITCVVTLQLGMREFREQHQPEPSLPSAEELRERAALGETGAAGVAAAPAGSLGHLMLVGAQLIPCVAPSTQVWNDGRLARGLNRSWYLVLIGHLLGTMIGACCAHMPACTPQRCSGKGTGTPWCGCRSGVALAVQPSWLAPSS